MSAAREHPQALLLDFDGVLRVFDPQHASGIERRYGLADATLGRSAFAWSRLRPAIVGEISHDAWLDAVAADLAEQIGTAAAAGAVRDWQAYRGEVVAAVADFVSAARTASIPVALATNATAALSADLQALGLVDAFDVVINSSVIGHHKPTREFFSTACHAVRRPASQCFFVDDDERNVRGARVAGLSAFRWTSTADLPYLAAALGM